MSFSILNSGKFSGQLSGKELLQLNRAPGRRLQPRLLRLGARQVARVAGPLLRRAGPPEGLQQLPLVARGGGGDALARPRHPPRPAAPPDRRPAAEAALLPAAGRPRRGGGREGGRPGRPHGGLPPPARPGTRRDADDGEERVSRRRLPHAHKVPGHKPGRRFNRKIWFWASFGARFWAKPRAKIRAS